MASIYEIDKQIADCIDFETGEVIDEEKLEQLQIERDVKIENIALFIKNLNADIKALKEEETNLAERRKSKENKVEQLKNYLTSVLDLVPFESARAKISFRKSVAVNILDETRIPSEYTKTETVVKVDKKAIGDALKVGIEIDGAELVQNQNIQIK